MSVAKDAASILSINLDGFHFNRDRQRWTQPEVSRQRLYVTAAQELDWFEWSQPFSRANPSLLWEFQSGSGFGWSS